jgi:hypothetical protein
MKAHAQRLLILASFSALLAECSTGSPLQPAAITAAPPTAAEADLVIRPAQIESVRAILGPGKSATVTIKGLLHDGATEIHRIDQQVVAGGVNISVTTTRPRVSQARVALIPFERVVTVDLTGIPRGRCPLTVNDRRYYIAVP